MGEMPKEAVGAVDIGRPMAAPTRVRCVSGGYGIRPCGNGQIASLFLSGGFGKRPFVWFQIHFFYLFLLIYIYIYIFLYLVTLSELNQRKEKKKRRYSHAFTASGWAEDGWERQVDDVRDGALWRGAGAGDWAALRS